MGYSKREAGYMTLEDFIAVFREYCKFNDLKTGENAEEVVAIDDFFS